MLRLMLFSPQTDTIINTAILSGQSVSLPVTVMAVGRDGTMSDVTAAATCQSSNENIIKVHTNTQARTHADTLSHTHTHTHAHTHINTYSLTHLHSLLFAWNGRCPATAPPSLWTGANQEWVAPVWGWSLVWARSVAPCV